MSYYSETNREINVRTEEHQEDIKNGNQNSHMAVHVLEKQHSISKM